MTEEVNIGRGEDTEVTRSTGFTDNSDTRSYEVIAIGDDTGSGEETDNCEDIGSEEVLSSGEHKDSGEDISGCVNVAIGSGVDSDSGENVGSEVLQPPGLPH